MLGAVDPVAALALAGGQEALALVVADGVDGEPRLVGEVVDAHGAWSGLAALGASAIGVPTSM